MAKLGVLLYRGYNIHDLASKSTTFEETSYLLLYGKLPTPRPSLMLSTNAIWVEHRTLPQGVNRRNQAGPERPPHGRPAHRRHRRPRSF